jgi:Flp pilus assembly pilin Flp
MGDILAAFALLIIAIAEGIVDAIAWMYSRLRYGY